MHAACKRACVYELTCAQCCLLLKPADRQKRVGVGARCYVQQQVAHVVHVEPHPADISVCVRSSLCGGGVTAVAANPCLPPLPPCSWIPRSPHLPCELARCLPLLCGAWRANLCENCFVGRKHGVAVGRSGSNAAEVLRQHPAHEFCCFEAGKGA